MTPRHSKISTLIFGVLAFCLTIPVLSFAATEGASAVTMEAIPAYQGYFKYGEWLPIWVTLDNAGPDLEAEIRVRVSGSYANNVYAVPVSLPAGARKIMPVYALPNNFSHEMKVELVVGGEVVLAEKLTVRPQPNINYLIGIIARERGALALLQGIRLPSNRSQVLIDLTPGELPERSTGLNSLDCLILNDIDTSSLTPGQKSALTAWVQRGGRLVIGGGAGAMQTAAGLPGELLPLKPSGVVDLEEIGALTDLAGSTPIRVPGPFVAATGEQLNGVTLAAQDGIPLVQEWTFGKGYVTFIALDLSTAPFDAWTGTTSFWETLITPGAAYPDWMPPDMSPRQMASNSVQNALYNLPSLDLPSARWLAILLAVYIILVGPVNYSILRWRKKLQLAWVTIPVITLVFSGMSFGLGYAKRGNDIIINKIAIVQAQPDGPAQVNTYIGLFSPANLSYVIEVKGNHLLSPVTMDYYDPWTATLPDTQDVTYIQGNPSGVRGLTVSQWSMQSFMTESTWEIGDLSGDLTIQDGKLTGTVTNQTGYPIQDVVIVLQSNFQRLGDLEPGESTDVSLDMDNFEQNLFFGSGISWRIYESQFDPSTGRTSRDAEFKRMILEGILDQATMYGGSFGPGSTLSAKDLAYSPEATLFGWIDEAPPEVLVNGNLPQETANTLYLTRVAYNFSEAEKVDVPVGMIPGLVAEMPASGGLCGGLTTSLWFDRGEAVFEFILPPELRGLDLDKLQLLINSDSGWMNAPNVELYHWETEAWQTLEKAKSGVNNLPEPETWVSQDSIVRVRLSLENNFQGGGGCYYAGLGLEGTRK
ncbi:MAG: hypothetical protein ABIG63_05470 [Chloroflexota bacterium]